MEKMETDDDDRPLQPITILKATIFVNPYKEMEDAEKKQEEEKRLEVRAAIALNGNLSFISRTHLAKFLQIHLLFCAMSSILCCMENQGKALTA